MKDLKAEGGDAFSCVEQYINNVWGGDKECFELLLRKGVYPYSYMDSTERFKEKLPDISAFYNDLSELPCPEKDYEHAKKMWQKFNLQNLGDLCDIYVCSDVLQLSAVFMKYREECLSSFSLDPVHYFTMPGRLTSTFKVSCMG